MKKSAKQTKPVFITDPIADSLVRIFITGVINHHNRFDTATKDIQRFLEQDIHGYKASPEETILTLQASIGYIHFAKDLVTMEALLKRSKIHIAEDDMYLIRNYLPVYKAFLTETWSKHKTHLEKLLKQAYKDYRSQ